MALTCPPIEYRKVGGLA